MGWRKRLKEEPGNRDVFEQTRDTRVCPLSYSLRLCPPFHNLHAVFTSVSCPARAFPTLAPDSLCVSFFLLFCPSSLYHFTMETPVPSPLPPRRLTPRPGPRIEVPFIFELCEIPRAKRVEHPLFLRSFSPFFYTAAPLFSSTSPPPFVHRVILAPSPGGEKPGNVEKGPNAGRD